ncbi:MAG: hypothetical protein HXX09_07830 [Bacteroidetes bacterium]|nr:hypothetical protein [Bacteroidota bacterium]
MEDNISKKKIWSKYLKYLKRFLLYFFGALFALILTAVILAYIFEDKVKNFVVDELNKKLNSEISVKEIDLSLIKKFPYASLTFTDVVAKDANNSNLKGDLLKAQNVYLQFSIWDLFDQNYRIKKIELSNATLNLVVYKDNTDNFHILKETGDTTNTSFKFDIQKFVFKNVHLSYKDFNSNQDYSIVANDALLKGKFSSDNYTLNINGNFLINHINSNEIKLFNNKKADLNFELDVNNKNSSYVIKEGDFNIGDLVFLASGRLTYSETQKDLDIKIVGKDLKLKSFVEEMPGVFKKYLKNYENKGEFSFDATIKGGIGENELPMITANFAISGAEIIEKKNDIKLENVSFKGYYTNGTEKKLSSNVLNITDFSAKLNSGSISGEIKIKDFSAPEISVELKSNLNLAEFQRFAKIDTLKSLSGDMKIDLSFKSKLNNFSHFTSDDFLKSSTSGKLVLNNVAFTIKNDEREYKSINGIFQFSNNDVIIDNMNANIGSNDINLKGYFRNVLSYFFLPNQKLMIDADFKSNNINMDELLSKKESAKDTVYNFKFSKNIDFKLNITINKFTFNKFSASRITGKIKLQNQKMIADPILLYAMGGKASLVGIIDNTSPNLIKTICDADIDGVDISKMFYQFNNFGQDYLQDKNIKGILTTDIQFKSNWNGALECDKKSIYTQANLQIEQGELINFKPLSGLSKFLKVSDLNDVKFSTLKNKIQIKNSVIIFPEMEIKSSAINIKASGTHGFDNEMDYHLKLLLSDVLARKAKKAKKETEDFGIIEDDGLGKTTLYITIYGNTSNPQFKYDAKGAKNKIILDLVKEKQTLKKILKEEFKIFKKDSTENKSNIKKEKDKKHNVIWNEDEK